MPGKKVGMETKALKIGIVHNNVVHLTLVEN
jgi:hypothetical protein